MLIHDSVVQTRHAQAVPQERMEDRLRKVLEDKLNQSKVLNPDSRFDVSSLESQMGRVYSSATFQRKLLLCNDKFTFERSKGYPELSGVYLTLPTSEKRFLCGFPSDFIPEYSLIKPTYRQTLSANKKDMIEILDDVEELKRGWRTVLVRLLKKGYITQNDIVKYFLPEYNQRMAWEVLSKMGPISEPNY